MNRVSKRFRGRKRCGGAKCRGLHGGNEGKTTRDKRAEINLKEQILCLKKKTELTPEQIAKLKPGSIAKYIISKFIVKEKIDYKRDMPGAMRLVKLISDPFFWNLLDAKDAQFESIYQMLTPNSIEFLQNKYNLFKLEIPKQPEYELSGKQGEDLKLEQKQKLMEFVN